MSGSGDKTANFNLKVGVDAKTAKSAALDLEKAKSVIQESKNAIDQYRIAMRSVIGTDAVAKAKKEELVKAIRAQNDQINRANISLRNAKSIVDRFNKSQKDGKTGAAGFGKAVEAFGGPLNEAKSKLSDVKKMFSGLSVRTTAWAGVAAIAVAATVALVVGFTSATYELTKFTLESANALRAMRLMREAATGSAQNAVNFGHDVDYMARRLATPKERLNDLAVEMARAFGQTKVSGQGIEDTFEAVSATSEAMGDSAGRAIQSIIDRGKLWGRTGIGRFELQGTGLKFENVAGALAKNLKIGMKQAQLQLLTGTANVNALAAALKDTVNARFGEINAKKMLDLNVIWAKFKENLQGLSDAVQDSPGFEKFLGTVKQVADLFSDSTFTGQQLKTVITALGNAFGTIVAGQSGNIVDFFKQAINYGLRMTNAMLSLTLSIVKFAHTSLGLDIIKMTLFGIAFTLGLVTAAVVAFGALAVGAFYAAVYPFYLLYDVVRGFYKLIVDTDWAGLGKSIVDGLVAGLKAGWNALKNAVTSMATGVRDTFKSILKEHSPSVVFRESGRNISRGVALGVGDESPRAQNAVATMVTSPNPQATSNLSNTLSGSPGGAAGGYASPPSVTLEVHVHGGSAKEVVQLMKEDSVLDKWVHALEMVVSGQGMPTQQKA